MKMSMVLAPASIAAFALSISPVSAQVVNFDSMSTFVSVNSYYAGGTNSAGETGPDYGIVFLSGDWTTTTAFGQTSEPNLAYSESGLGSINFLNGMTTGLNFSYGGFTDTTMSIWSGLDGTGTLLGSFLLAANDPFDFDFVALPFAGVAHSVTIVGGAAQFGWDDITFGRLQPGVPEPEGWAMMILGFGAAGFALRNRARVRAVSYAA